MNADALRLRLLLPALIALLVSASAATAQDLGWTHWRSGEVVTGQNYSYRVVRADPGGAGWEEIEVNGTGFPVLNGQNGAPTRLTTSFKASRLLLLRGTKGIQAAFAAGKIPAWARDQLLAEERIRLAACPVTGPVYGPRCQDLYVVSRTALKLIAGKQAVPTMPLAIGAPVGAPAPGFFSCSDYDKEFRRSPGYDQHVSRTKTLAGSNGSFALTISSELDLDVQTAAAVLLRVKTAFCVPWVVYLKRATIDLDVDLAARLDIDGIFATTASGKSLRTELTAIPLAAATFTIGPVPVVIPFDLPIAVGVEEIAADAAGKVALGATAKASFARHYVCDPDCSSADPEGEADVSGGVATVLEGARVRFFAFADAGLRASLYHPKVAQITAGVRPGLDVDAFYRAPAPGCGDGEEVVEGRLVDLDGRIDVFALASVWKLADGHWPATLFDSHFALFDFGVSPGSLSVITPKFTAPETFSPPADLPFSAAMRSCWPWDKGVTYRFSVEVREGQFETAEATSAAASESVGTTKRVEKFGISHHSVEPLQDSHGRNLAGHATHRTARGNLPPIGWVDAAVNAVDGSGRVPLGGKIAASGWAFDPDGAPAAPVEDLALTLGAVREPLEVLTLGDGLGGDRQDVAAAFDRPDARWSGWSTRVTHYRNVRGSFSLTATARDAERLAAALSNNPRLEVVLNDTIANPGEIDEADDGAVYYGDTGPSGATVGLVDYKDDYHASCGLGAQSEDAVYRLWLTRRRRVRLWTEGSAFDTVLHVKAAAAPLPSPARAGRAIPPPPPPGALVEIACNDDVGAGVWSGLELDLAPGNYYVIVDGYGTNKRGPFQLRVSFATSNVAPAGAATQSSKYPHACSGADKAIDGDTDGDFAACSVTHTRWQPGAWWEVDLGQVHDVAQVKLFNRTDCCGERLGFFDVELSTDRKTWSGRYLGRVAETVESFFVNQPARFVRVRLRGANYLSLAEVQVWAYQ